MNAMARCRPVFSDVPLWDQRSWERVRFIGLLEAREQKMEGSVLLDTADRAMVYLYIRKPSERGRKMEKSKSFIIFSKWRGWLITGLLPIAAGLLALCAKSSWTSLLNWGALAAGIYFAFGYATALIFDRMVKKQLKEYSPKLDAMLLKLGEKKYVKHAGPEIPTKKVGECLQEDPSCGRILSECKAANIMINLNMMAPPAVLLGIILFAV